MKMNKSRILNLTISKMVFLVLTIVTVCSNVKAADFVVDKTASQVKWEAKKVTGKHNGTIAIANGSLSVDKSGINGGTLVIDMKTIVDLDLTDAGLGDIKKALAAHRDCCVHR